MPLLLRIYHTEGYPDHQRQNRLTLLTIIDSWPLEEHSGNGARLRLASCTQVQSIRPWRRLAACPVLIGADHNNWRNLVQSGVHPPLFAKGYSLGWRLIAQRFELEEANSVIYIYIGRGWAESKKEGWTKKSEREKRMRNRISTLKLLLSLVTQPLLCVPPPAPVARRFRGFRCSPRREKRDVRLSPHGKLGKKFELVGTCP